LFPYHPDRSKKDKINRAGEKNIKRLMDFGKERMVWDAVILLFLKLIIFKMFK